MKRTLITSVLLVGLIGAGTSPLAEAQRTRNPGGSSGGGSGSSGGSSSSSGSSGSVAVPRSGGSSSSGGGSVSSRPSGTSASPSGGSRRARVPGGGVGAGGSTAGYSRPRDGAPVTGYAVPRGSVATLPPIISGPIYWGPGDWYFYPWGYGSLALGYFWDPWMWGGYYGGAGYPWVDPYGGGGGGGGYGGWDAGAATTSSVDPANPLDPNLPTGGIRLKVDPRDAEVYVDGFYAGRVDDFDGARQKLQITRGAHQIELRAQGYETETFNVTIVVGETTTYKTSLKRQ